MTTSQVSMGQDVMTGPPSGAVNPGQDGPVPRLLMKGISKRFGGTLALSEVDFEVRAGEIHGLVGQNGAGKSTLMKIVAGDYRPDNGKIFIDGRQVEIPYPRRGLALGVGIVYQELSLLPNLTVAENIALGREQARFGVVSREAVREQAQRALSSLGIKHIGVETKVSRLSIAEQQLVEIAKALSRDVRILVLDEPTATLSLHDTKRLFASLRHLVKTGVGVVFVSHRYGEVLEICDRCTVLRNGKVVAREQVVALTLERLVDLTLGEAVTRSHGKQRSGSRTLSIEGAEVPVLAVEHLAVGSTVVDVSFEVWAGEVLGLCGLVGSGQSEVARALYGDAKDVLGRVFLSGKPVRLSSPRQAAARGTGFITENRRDEGIFPDLSVVPNVTAASLRESWVSRRVPLISPRREEARSRKVLEEVKPPSCS
jgi:ribose transport system ATP-binding protein